MKKLLILFICIHISLMPLVCFNEFSFADTTGGGGAGGDAWIAVNDNETMVAAFKAYCRTRNFNKTFTYSDGLASQAAKVIIKYDYDQIQKLCALTGTDIDTVNAGIWYKIDQNGILKFFFNSFAMNKLNQLYSALLTEHNIGEDENKTLFTGQSFQDSNGDITFCYESTSLNSNNNNFTKEGTIYKYTGIELKNLYVGQTVYFNGITQNQNLSYNVTSTTIRQAQVIYVGSSDSGRVYIDGGLENWEYIKGGTIILHHYQPPYIDGYYLATLVTAKYTENGVTGTSNWTQNLQRLNTPDVNNVSVNANQGEFNTPPENKSMEAETDSDTINNFITNNNSNVTNNYYDDDDPPSPPPYTNPYDNNPTGGTIDGDGSINFQMPDLNIDWNLGLNVENLPFPFSIPFDFNNALKMLDVEPETPRFQGTIHLPYINYDWEIDLDFGKYDEYESLINMFQKVFLFGYVITLIIATRSIMHIY